MERARERIGRSKFADGGLRRLADFEPDERGLSAVGLRHVHRPAGLAIDVQRTFALEGAGLAHLETQRALPAGHRTVRAHDVVAVDEVVIVYEQAVTHVQRVAAAPIALGDEHAFRATLWNLGLRGDAVRTVTDVRRRRPWDTPRAGTQLPVCFGGHAVGVRADEPGKGVVQRQHLVSARLGEPTADHLGELFGLLSAQVVQFIEVLVQVVELPLVGIESGARAVPGDRLPAVVPDSAVAQHLEVLARLLRWFVRGSEAVGQAGAFDWLLGHAVDLGGRPHPGQFEHRRRDVGDVVELPADAAAVRDHLRVVDD